MTARNIRDYQQSHPPPSPRPTKLRSGIIKSIADAALTAEPGSDLEISDNDPNPIYIPLRYRRLSRTRCL